MVNGSPHPLLGRLLGGVYRLDQLIALGSTSAVFRATHVRLEQPVAVKVLAGSVAANGTLVARFEAEAKVQAKLHHPHIVTVHDFVADGDLRAIAMEYVQGAGLDQLMYELAAPMDLDRIKDILRPVLEAIDYAHTHGIVHRDLKPSNILVSEIAGREFPKVMDFGIAKVLAEEVSVTAPGAMLGTLLFMSPEQCKALKTVDGRSDIYSLGVTLYQMSTGMVPFYSESAFDIMLAHVQTPPVPPRELVPTVSSKLEAVILRAMEKDPDDRFGSAAEMAAALENATGTFLAVSASGARPTPTPAIAMAPIEIVPTSPPLAPRTDESETIVRMPDELPARAAAPAADVPATSAFDAASEFVDAEPARELERHTPSSWNTVPRDLRGIAAPGLGRRTELPLEKPSRAGPAESTAVGDGLRALRSHPSSTRERPSTASSGSGVPYPQDVTPAARLQLRVGSKDEWKRHFDGNIAGGGIFVPSGDPPRVGATVRLEIVFAGGPRLFMSGLVTWRRPLLKDPRMPPGVGVQVHPNERSKIQYLNRWIDGSAEEQRRIRRLPVKLRVAYTGRMGRRVNFTRDISEEGVFVRSRELLDLDTPIELLLLPHDKSLPFRLHGVVSRLVRDPEDRGMGIKLRFPSDDERIRFASFIESLEKQLILGQLGEEILF